jgi:hypothetical protein
MHPRQVVSKGLYNDLLPEKDFLQASAKNNSSIADKYRNKTFILWKIKI